MLFFPARISGFLRVSRGPAIAVAAVLLLSGCGGSVPKASTPSAPATTTASCPSPQPTVTVTATAGAADAHSSSQSARTSPAACPVATQTVTVALHKSGENCQVIGDKYSAIEPALECTKDKSGNSLWLTAAQIQQVKDQLAQEKAAADAAEAARQKAAADAEAAKQKAEQESRAKTTPVVPAAPQAPANPGGSVYYANCTAARAAGAAPIYRGQPGYRPALDRDGDGVACER